MIRVSADVWDGDPRVVDRTLAHQGRRVKRISGFSGFSPRGPWEAPVFIGFLNRDSMCMPGEVSFPSVGLIGNRVLGPLFGLQVAWRSQNSSFPPPSLGSAMPHTLQSHFVASSRYVSFRLPGKGVGVFDFLPKAELQVSVQGSSTDLIFVEKPRSSPGRGLQFLTFFRKSS